MQVPNLVLSKNQVDQQKVTWTMQDMMTFTYYNPAKQGIARYFPDLIVQVRRCQHDHSWWCLLVSSCIVEMVLQYQPCFTLADEWRPVANAAESSGRGAVAGPGKQCCMPAGR